MEAAKNGDVPEAEHFEVCQEWGVRDQALHNVIKIEKYREVSWYVCVYGVLQKLGEGGAVVQLQDSGDCQTIVSLESCYNQLNLIYL